MREHRPLRKRNNVLSCDVADAIERLVGANDRALPEAFDKSAVVDQLILISHLRDDGTYDEVSPIVRRVMRDQFYNRLTNTAVFQMGYRQYEERSKFPVVPVTDFFFKIVYEDGGCADVLDAMTELEIRQSLPKRKGFGRRSEDEDGKVLEYIIDEGGERLIFGELAGIVIFPAKYQSDLLRTWLQRMASGSQGKLRSTVDRIEHARPDTAATASLKHAAEPVVGAMQRALPRPRPR